MTPKNHVHPAVVSRFTDIVARPDVTHKVPLPAIDWAIVNQQAPEALSVSADPLPKVDAVIITWTSAEWQAMAHVFLFSATNGIPSPPALEAQWKPYRPAGQGAAMGSYQLVGINNLKVLLYKSETHLAYSPWIAGMNTMIDGIISDFKPAKIYSIGTAGGGNYNENLGDAIITNAGYLDLSDPANLVSYNKQTFACPNWTPPPNLLQATQDNLFLPLNSVVNDQSLEAVLQDAKTDCQTKYHKPFTFTVAEMLNANLDPANLGAPKAIPMENIPLNTSDGYLIAAGNTAYSAYEMDDAAIAHEASVKGVDYLFVRNISDTDVPTATPAGKPIDTESRNSWSSAIYNRFGLYTSFNGALAAWALIAG